MRYYIIAGEASGDLHASNLVAEIKKKDKKAEFRGCGGDKMKAQGVDLLKHYRTMAYMGFVEVVANLRKVLRNIAQCKKEIAVVETGKFGADMQVSLVNDGPFTIMLD